MMGSGYFPLMDNELLAIKIRKFVSDTEKDIQEIIDSGLSGETGQYDNSFWDGYGISRIQLAIKLLKESVVNWGE